MISPTTAVQITAVVLFFHVQAKKLLSHAFPKIDHSCLLDKVVHAFFLTHFDYCSVVPTSVRTYVNDGS